MAHSDDTDVPPPNKFHRLLLDRIWWVLGGLAVIIPIIVGSTSIYDAIIEPYFKTDVEGTWCVTDTVEKAQRPGLVGISLRFELHLKQDDEDRLTGDGRKVSVNGRPIQAAESTKILVDTGFVRGKKVTLSYTERSDLDPDRVLGSGFFHWTLKNDETLEGRFGGNANIASGSSVARKAPLGCE